MPVFFVCKLLCVFRTREGTFAYISACIGAFFIVDYGLVTAISSCLKYSTQECTRVQEYLLCFFALEKAKVTLQY